MAHLNDLYETYKGRGFDVIALTNEDRTNVERYVYQREPKLTYPIAIKAPNPYGVSGIPHAYLIDVDGKVVWEGSPGSLSSKLVEDEIRKVRRFADLEGRRAAKAGKLLDKGELGKAWTAAGKILEREDADPEDAAGAKEIVDHLTKLADRRIEWAAALAADGRIVRAEEILSGLQKEFKRTPVEKKAGERLTELQGNASSKALAKADDLVEKVLSRVKTPVNDKEREAVLRMLEGKLQDFEGPGKAIIQHYVEIFSADWVAKRT